MEWYQWLSLLGVPAILAAIVTYFVTKWLKKRDARKEHFNELEKKENEEKQLALIRQENLVANKQLVQEVKSILAVLSDEIKEQGEKLDSYIAKNELIMKEANERDEKLMRGLQAVLRDRLKHLYAECDKKGYATIEDKEEFENMYTRYHNLGENGVMDACREKILNLPNSKQTTKKKKQLNENIQ